MKYRIQLYREDTNGQEGWVSIHRVEYHPELLERFTHLGIITVRDGFIHSQDLERLNKVLRLRSCLGVNLAGASIILDLLDKIEQLQQELRTKQP